MSEAEQLLEQVRARRVLPPAAEVKHRRIRDDAHVSQHEMARALGVSWTAIYRWERGSRPRQQGLTRSPTRTCSTTSSA